MKIRNLIFAAASAALVATPIAAQANTRAASSNVAVSANSLGSTTRGSAAVAGEEFAGVSGLTLALLLTGLGGLPWTLTKATAGNRSPGANS